MVNYAAWYFAGFATQTFNGGNKKVKNEYKYKINVTLFLFYKNIS